MQYKAVCLYLHHGVTGEGTEEDRISGTQQDRGGIGAAIKPSDLGLSSLPCSCLGTSNWGESLPLFLSLDGLNRGSPGPPGHPCAYSELGSCS